MCTCRELAKQELELITPAYKSKDGIRNAVADHLVCIESISAKPPAQVCG